MKLTVITIYCTESKRSLKLSSDELKRSVRNSNFEKNEIAKHCEEGDLNKCSWDQDKFFDRESRLIPH